jgi:outer membrane lipopolysaccharide assembly protein LptE/RlpB
MKKLKTLYTIAIVFLLTSCGFTPMLKEVDLSKVQIKSISYEGPSGLTYYLKNNLNINTSRAFNNGYTINMNISEAISSVTKNTAGITTEEEVKVTIGFSIVDKNNKKIGEDSVSGSRVVSVTNNVSTDDEVKRIEKENIITNLIQQLTFSIRAKIISSQQ